MAEEADRGAVLTRTRTFGGSPSGSADALLSCATLEDLAANVSGAEPGQAVALRSRARR